MLECPLCNRHFHKKNFVGHYERCSQRAQWRSAQKPSAAEEQRIPVKETVVVMVDEEPQPPPPPRRGTTWSEASARVSLYTSAQRADEPRVSLYTNPGAFAFEDRRFQDVFYADEPLHTELAIAMSAAETASPNNAFAFEDPRFRRDEMEPSTQRPTLASASRQSGIAFGVATAVRREVEAPRASDPWETVVRSVAYPTRSASAPFPGLINTSSVSCYLNSSIQLLNAAYHLGGWNFASLPHIGALIREPRTNRALGSDAYKETLGIADFRGAPYFERGSEEDAGELITQVLDRAREKGDTEFNVEERLEWTCRSCKAVHSAPSVVFPLWNVDPTETPEIVPSHKSIVKEARLCETCNQQVTDCVVTSRTTVNGRAFIAAAKLYGHNGAAAYKLRHKIKFPSEFNGYQKTAVIIHEGETPRTGHYVCARKHATGWYLISDERVQKISEEALNSLQHYVVLYLRR